MARHISTTAIGGFIIGIIGLLSALLLFFGGEKILADSQKFELVYRNSIQGLRVGAPVTIKGVKIGEVITIQAKMQAQDLAVYNSVVVSIQEDLLQLTGKTTRANSTTVLEDLLDKGLAAQLKTQSLLTGLLYIDVDFFGADNPPHYEDVKTDYPQFPTVQTNLEALSKTLEDIDFKAMADDLSNILQGLDRMVNNQQSQQLTQTLTDTAQSVQQLAQTANTQLSALHQSLAPLAGGAQTLLNTMNNELPDLLKALSNSTKAIEQTAANLDMATSDTRFLLSDDSPLLDSLTNAAQSLQRASDQVNHLSHLLAREPEALIQGKREQ